MQRSGWGGKGERRVRGISTILYASAVQIKCKLKSSALALRKGDANLLLISLLCSCKYRGSMGELLLGGGERGAGDGREKLRLLCGQLRP